MKIKKYFIIWIPTWVIGFFIGRTMLTVREWVYYTIGIILTTVALMLMDVLDND